MSAKCQERPKCAAAKLVNSITASESCTRPKQTIQKQSRHGGLSQPGLVQANYPASSQRAEHIEKCGILLRENLINPSQHLTVNGRTFLSIALSGIGREEHLFTRLAFPLFPV
jgi:hypothetical protein